MPNLSFFRAFNAVYGKVGRAASEECILALLQAKCLPILLYGTEACPLLSRDRQSFGFTVNRLFMKIVRTGSPCVVKECQQNVNFLPIESQLEIRTATFLQAFSATKNTLSLLFKHCAVTQLSSIFSKYKPNVIRSASQLARIMRYNLS